MGASSQYESQHTIQESSVYLFSDKDMVLSRAAPQIERQPGRLFVWILCANINSHICTKTLCHRGSIRTASVGSCRQPFSTLSLISTLCF